MNHSPPVLTGIMILCSPEPERSTFEESLDLGNSAVLSHLEMVVALFMGFVESRYVSPYL